MSTTDRDKWVGNWGRKEPDDFFWYRSHIEPPLLELVESLADPSGTALDVGCGSGPVTRFLAGHFARVIGVDHAITALHQAVAAAPSRAEYAVSDVCALPFPDRAFSFVSDRGCLHVLDDDAIRRYLDEVTRVLEPGGRFTVIARVHDAFPAVRPGLRRVEELRARRREQRAGQWTVTPRRLRAYFPRSLTVERVVRVRQISNAGYRQHHLFAVAVRR